MRQPNAPSLVECRDIEVCRLDSEHAALVRAYLGDCEDSEGPVVEFKLIGPAGEALQRWIKASQEAQT